MSTPRKRSFVLKRATNETTENGVAPAVSLIPVPRGSTSSTRATLNRTTGADLDPNGSGIRNKAFDKLAERTKYQFIKNIDKTHARCIAVSLDGNTVYNGTREGSFQIRDASTGEVVSALDLVDEHKRRVEVLKLLLRSENEIWAGCADGIIRIFDSTKSEFTRTLLGHTGSISSLVMLNPRTVCSSSVDFTIRMWSTETFECKQVILASHSWMNCLQVVDETLWAGSDDGKIRIYDERGDLLKELDAHKQGVLCMTIDFKSRVWSGSRDSTIKIWNTEDGKCVHTITRHKGWVNCLHSEGHNVWSAGADKTIFVWDSQEIKIIEKLTIEKGWITHMASIQRASNGSPDDSTATNNNDSSVTTAGKINMTKMWMACSDKTIKVYRIWKPTLRKTKREGLSLIQQDEADEQPTTRISGVRRRAVSSTGPKASVVGDSATTATVASSPAASSASSPLLTALISPRYMNVDDSPAAFEVEAPQAHQQEDTTTGATNTESQFEEQVNNENDSDELAEEEEAIIEQQQEEEYEAQENEEDGDNKLSNQIDLELALLGSAEMLRIDPRHVLSAQVVPPSKRDSAILMNDEEAKGASQQQQISEVEQIEVDIEAPQFQQEEMESSPLVISELHDAELSVSTSFTRDVETLEPSNERVDLEELSARVKVEEEERLTACTGKANDEEQEAPLQPSLDRHETVPQHILTEETSSLKGDLTERLELASIIATTTTTTDIQQGFAGKQEEQPASAPVNVVTGCLSDASNNEQGGEENEADNVVDTSNQADTEILEVSVDIEQEREQEQILDKGECKCEATIESGSPDSGSNHYSTDDLENGTSTRPEHTDETDEFVTEELAYEAPIREDPSPAQQQEPATTHHMALITNVPNVLEVEQQQQQQQWSSLLIPVEPQPQQQQQQQQDQSQQHDSLQGELVDHGDGDRSNEEQPLPEQTEEEEEEAQDENVDEEEEEGLNTIREPNQRELSAVILITDIHDKATQHEHDTQEERPLADTEIESSSTRTIATQEEQQQAQPDESGDPSEEHNDAEGHDDRNLQIVQELKLGQEESAVSEAQLVVPQVIHAQTEEADQEEDIPPQPSLTEQEEATSISATDSQKEKEEAANTGATPVVAIEAVGISTDLSPSDISHLNIQDVQMVEEDNQEEEESTTIIVEEQSITTAAEHNHDGHDNDDNEIDDVTEMDQNNEATDNGDFEAYLPPAPTDSTFILEATMAPPTGSPGIVITESSLYQSDPASACKTITLPVLDSSVPEEAEEQEQKEAESDPRGIQNRSPCKEEDAEQTEAEIEEQDNENKKDTQLSSDVATAASCEATNEGFITATTMAAVIIDISPTSSSSSNNNNDVEESSSLAAAIANATTPNSDSDAIIIDAAPTATATATATEAEAEAETPRGGTGISTNISPSEPIMSMTCIVDHHQQSQQDQASPSKRAVASPITMPSIATTSAQLTVTTTTAQQSNTANHHNDSNNNKCNATNSNGDSSLHISIAEDEDDEDERTALISDSSKFGGAAKAYNMSSTSRRTFLTRTLSSLASTLTTTAGAVSTTTTTTTVTRRLSPKNYLTTTTTTTTTNDALTQPGATFPSEPITLDVADDDGGSAAHYQHHHGRSYSNNNDNNNNNDYEGYDRHHDDDDAHPLLHDDDDDDNDISSSSSSSPSKGILDAAATAATAAVSGALVNNNNNNRKNKKGRRRCCCCCLCCALTALTLLTGAALAAGACYYYFVVRKKKSN